MPSSNIYFIARTLYGTGINYLWHGFVIALKIWMFENANWLYLRLFGGFTADSLKYDVKGERVALTK